MSDLKLLTVKCYERALTLDATLTCKTSVPEIASSLARFVNGEAWKLEALDVSMRTRNRRNSVELVIERAQAVVDWVQLPPSPKPERSHRITRKPR